MWFIRFHKHTRIVTLLQCVQVNKLTTIPRNGGVPAVQVCSRDTASFQSAASNWAPGEQAVECLQQMYQTACSGAVSSKTRSTLQPPPEATSLPAHTQGITCPGWVSPLQPALSWARTFRWKNDLQKPIHAFRRMEELPTKPHGLVTPCKSTRWCRPTVPFVLPKQHSKMSLHKKELWMSLHKRSPPVTEIFSETQQDN